MHNTFNRVLQLEQFSFILCIAASVTSYSMRQAGFPLPASPLVGYHWLRASPLVIGRIRVVHYAFCNWDVFRTNRSMTSTLPEQISEQRPLRVRSSHFCLLDPLTRGVIRSPALRQRSPPTAGRLSLSLCFL